jgi:hypothetical protein
LALIHLARDGNQQEADWIENSRHHVSHYRPAPIRQREFKKIQPSDHTGCGAGDHRQAILKFHDSSILLNACSSVLPTAQVNSRRMALDQRYCARIVICFDDGVSGILSNRL